MKKAFTVFIGLLVSALACWWIAGKTDFHAVLAEIQRLPKHWLVLGLLGYSVGFIPRILRSATMAHSIGLSPSLYTTGSAVIVGYAANNVLPLRLGEVVRTLYFSLQTKAPRSISLALIMAERLADLFLLTFFLASSLGLTWWLLEGLPASLSALFIPSLSIFFLLIAGALAVAPLRPRLESLAQILPKRLAQFSLNVLSAITLLQRRELLMVVGLQSLAVWVFEGSLLVCLAIAFGFPYPLLLGLLTLAIVNLSVLLPSSPGYVGVFHAATLFALTPFGISADQALAYALLIHGLPYLLVTGSGFALLLRDATLWLKLLRSTRDPQDNHVALSKDNG